MIIADTSLLIVLGRLQRLGILESLFGKVIIPPAVYQEAALQTKIPEQAEFIEIAIRQKILVIMKPEINHTFNRRLGAGEKEVLCLALEHSTTAIIMDDKKARNEAQELGFRLFYTADILKAADKRSLINSYTEVVNKLMTMNIFLPE